MNPAKSVVRILAFLLPLSLSSCGGSLDESLDAPEEGETGTASSELFVFPKTSTPAGGGRHRETRLARADVCSSWDGRLFFNYYVRDGIPGHAVSVFRPEALTLSADGYPQLSRRELNSPSVEFPGSPTTGVHLAVFPDTAYPENPYPSTLDGTPDPNGSALTYRLGMVTVQEESPQHYLALSRGKVVIADPRSASARVHLVERSAPVAMTTPSGQRLFGYEPTTSLDGRLVIYNGDAHVWAPLYSHNPDPFGSPRGWSDEGSVTAMFYRHGPGAPAEALVDGIPFSKRYPIAQQPMKDPRGTPFGPSEYITGPYPWLSFDSTELFFPTDASFFGATRSGVVAVGARTNWTIRHLDGAINPTRSNVSSDGSANHWEGNNASGIPLDPEGSTLKRAYTSLVQVDGTALGDMGYQRILMNGIGLSGSMWNPFQAQPTAGVPISPQPHTYYLGLSHSRRWVEIPLFEVPDRNYVVSLPMNEMLEFNRTALDIVHNSRPVADFWKTHADSVTYSRDSTPDTSGNLRNGLLVGGAKFPFDHYDTQRVWSDFWARKRLDPSLPIPADVLQGDRTYGVVGNAIFFPGRGAVQVALDASSQARLASGPGFTVELWVKRLRATTATLPVARVGGLFSLSLAPDGTVLANVSGSRLPASSSVGRVTGDGLDWNHLALVRDGREVRFYLNGAVVFSFASPADAVTPESTFQVGPGSSALSDSVMLLSLDEVRLSNVPRTPQEILQAALVRQQVQNRSLVTVPAALRALPQLLPDGIAPTAAQISLGARLFSERGLSVDGTMSCATCHDPARHYTDGRATARGRGGVATMRNTPAMHNRLFGEAQAMDGAASSIEHQMARVFENPVELGWSIDRAAAWIRGRAEYAPLFNAAFGVGAAGITGDHLARALAAFTRSLVSANARFDRGQLTAEEQRGRGLFFGKARCAMCHNGPNFTDEGYHAVGLLDSVDPGRIAFTGRSADRGKFRTPTLRDVARTAPYFHDGRAATLADVVSFYNTGGDAGAPRDITLQPLGLTPGEQADLVAFLRSLNGDGLSPEGPTPELVLVGAGCAANECLWMLGANYGDDTEVLLSTTRDGAPLAAYQNPGRSGTVGPYYAYDTTTVPGLGWAGRWDRISLRITDPVLLGALRGSGVWVKLRRGTRSATPYRIAAP